MDDRYASAFNDVDLCLKVRAAGRSVVYSAQAEMYHFESLSYGRHYSEDEVARWEKDVALMRNTWHEVIADDPFHNPNLSLQRGHEWELAFPPRLGRNRTAEDKADIGISVCDHARGADDITLDQISTLGVKRSIEIKSSTLP